MQRFFQMRPLRKFFLLDPFLSPRHHQYAMCTMTRSGCPTRAPPDSCVLPLTERNRVSRCGLKPTMPAAGDVDDAEGNNTVDTVMFTLDLAAGSAEHGPNGPLTNVSSNSPVDNDPAVGKPVELHLEVCEFSAAIMTN